MKFKIHATNKDGEADFFVVSGDTIEEVRELANKEIEKRDWWDCWSEEIVE